MPLSADAILDRLTDVTGGDLESGGTRSYRATCPNAANHGHLPGGARRASGMSFLVRSDGTYHVGCVGGCSPATIYAGLGVNTADVPPQNAPGRTDLGNAQRFAAAHGERVKYCEGLGWCVFTGTHWEEDRTLEVVRLMKDVVLGMLREAADLRDDTERERLAKWAVTSQSAGRIHAAVDLARSAVVVRAERFDRDPLLLNLRNGTYELATGTFREHRREDYLTKCAGVMYDRGATCPRWEAFLARILPDAAVRPFLQRFFGYCLSGLTVEQVMVILWGSGANGKSVLLAVLQSVLGEYAMTMSFSTLAAQRQEGRPRNDLARLVGARLATAVEAGAGGQFDEPTLKQLTGGDRISVRKLYKEEFQFSPTFKVVVAANHRPAVSADEAMWRRLLLVLFPVVIPEAERDPHLTATLAAEGSGILNWLLGGWRAYAAHGLQVPDAVKAAVEDYKSVEDTLAGFLGECVEPGEWVLHKELYASYTRWAAEAGEEAASAKRFSRLLSDRNVRRDKRGPRKTTRWLGIQLKTQSPAVESGRCGGSTPVSTTFPMKGQTEKVTQTGVNPPHRPHPTGEPLAVASIEPNW